MRVRPLTIVVPLLLAALVAATFGVALTVLREDDPAPPALQPTAQPAPQAAAEPQEEPVAAPATPRALFAETCGGCHTLADAGTAGQFGPDLDAVRPSAADVRRMLRTGSLDGVMQPDLLEGAAARRVAAYVARVAGRG
jgi:mono/diheme cytochrome c family protein